MKENTKVKANTKKKPNIHPDEAVKMKMTFFKTGQRWLKWGIVVSIILCSISTFFLYSISSNKDSYVYLTVDEDGRLMKLIPLSKPNHKEPVIAQWLVDAMVDTFDFNYLNMKEQLSKKAGHWFTTSGKTSLVSTLRDEGSLQVITDNQFIVQLKVKSNPILLEERLNSRGYYEWIFQLPAIITYTNEKNVFSNDTIFTVSVVRRSMLEDKRGLGVSKIIMTIDK